MTAVNRKKIVGNRITPSLPFHYPTLQGSGMNKVPKPNVAAGKKLGKIGRV